MKAVLIALGCVAVAGCGGEGAPSQYQSQGPHPVGHTAYTVEDTARSRSLDVLVWYPAAEAERASAAAGVDIAELAPAARRGGFSDLVAAAPDPATRHRTRSARDATPAATPAKFPVVVYSHCHECVNVSGLTIAERLASHGMVVIAPNHAGNTVFEQLDGTGAALEDAFLAVRAGDISAVLTAALGNDAPMLLRGRLDGGYVGMMGHSFGGATTGRVLQDDKRFRAGVTMGAPIASPFFPSVQLTSIQQPLLFVELMEDNSIGIIGNNLLLANFDDAKQPVWLVQVADAGHWSVSDICGLTSHFPAGCTTPATRQTNGAGFSYLDITIARDLVATRVTEFFALQLQGDDTAATALARSAGVITAEHRN